MCRVTQSHIAVNNRDEFAYLPGALTSLIITANTSDDVGFVTLDLTRFHNLKRLHVMDGSLKKVKDLKLDGLAKLESIEVGKDCFSKAVSGTFEVKNCESLKTIAIGESCFCLYDSFALERMALLLHFMSRLAYAIFHNDREKEFEERERLETEWIRGAGDDND